MRIFKYQKDDNVVLKNILVNPSNFEFINVGKITDVRNRFSFKPTLYLIYLADGVYGDRVICSCFSKWFTESEIKEILKET